MKNGCFTKHPLKNGCLEFQVKAISLTFDVIFQGAFGSSGLVANGVRNQPTGLSGLVTYPMPSQEKPIGKRSKWVFPKIGGFFPQNG